MAKDGASEKVDVVLIGAGIMSGTLGVLLKLLEPDWKIVLFEALDGPAQESSNPWNNAGTGHAANCELNYTPLCPDGSVDISKAIQINESFEVSKQCWSSLIQRGIISSADRFIHRVPHYSFVHAEFGVSYLRKRYETLRTHPFYARMQYSEDHTEIAAWLPLIMEGRDPAEPVAVTRVAHGSDVNFGALTEEFIGYLQQTGVEIQFRNRVTHLSRQRDGLWNICTHSESGETRSVCARFVFVGAGGGALPLLQKSGIPEGHGFGGFPVGGQWLRCRNPELIERHYAKVYGTASLGAPPMSVPHLDTRIVDGKKGLLFGPYATFSTRFLKKGSLLDLPLSLHPDNLIPMLSAGAHNIQLTEYLIGQVLQSDEARIAALHAHMPSAKMEDWELVNAGQRVQVIKSDLKSGGVLAFGTEVVASADGSLAALLGASPGASTSISIMLKLLAECFPDLMKTSDWTHVLKELIPSYGVSLTKDLDLYHRLFDWTSETLGLREDQS